MFWNKKEKMEATEQPSAPLVNSTNEMYRVGYDSVNNMVTLTLMDASLSMTLTMNKAEVNRLKRMLDSAFNEECEECNHGES